MEGKKVRRQEVKKRRREEKGKRGIRLR